jgi:nicotinamidase-related amidase
MHEDPYTAPDFTAAALITIDTQRDVLDGGALEVPGTSAVLPQIGALLSCFRELDAPIVHVVRVYSPDGSDADLCRRSLLEQGAPILHAGVDGTQLAEELLPRPEARLDDERLLAGRVQTLGASEVAIYKPRWGAFYRTPLEDHLRGREVSTLVFSGCNFPNCPRASIYEASERDFRVVVASDAVSGLYERGERELANIGVRLMSSDEVGHAMRAARREQAVGAATAREPSEL